MIASGGANLPTKVYNEQLFNEIKNNVC